MTFKVNVIYPVLFIEICSLKKPILMEHPVESMVVTNIVVFTNDVRGIKA